MKRIIITLVAALAAIWSNAQTISVDAPSAVGRDEQFSVAFTIDGESGKPSDFNWDAGSDFQIVWGPQTGSSIQIVNGKTKSSSYTYTYILLPKKTGTFDLPVATAKVKGKEVSSQPFKIQVVANGGSSSGSSASQSGSSSSQGSSSTADIPSDDLFLKLSLSKTSAVIGEPITATLKIYQRVNIAGFEGARFPSFNGFWSQETSAPQNIEFKRETIGDKIYNAALIRSYVLIPQQAGTLNIDSAELVCVLNVRSQSNRSRGSIFDGFFDDGYRTVRKRVTTPPISVNVRALPSGAPASFGGGVGSFSIKAVATKDSIKTHEAVSLKVTVSGTGNVSLLEAPKINFPPDFETYDVKTTENMSGAITGSKTFEYPFIPRSHGQFSLGPVEYSYYDVNAGKYVTLMSDPVEINVARGEVQESQGNGPLVSTIDRKGVKNLATDIRYISTKTPDLDGAASFAIANALWWILLALIVIAAVAVWAVFKFAGARRADVAGTRNRKATKMALKRLGLAKSFLDKNLYTAFYEELHRALLGFISDKLNMNVEDLDKDNISRRLADNGVSDALAAEFVALLDACEYARYSPDSGNAAMSAHYDSAVTVISSIDSNMKNPPRNMKTLGLILPLLLMAHMGNAAESYPETLWNAGVQAYESGNWQEAVHNWEGIAAAGTVSTELETNIGDAYFKSNEYALAILHYERALKIDPSNSDARFNLEIAESFTQDRIDPVPEFILKSWIRQVCYMFPSDAWAWIALILFALTAALVLVFLLAGTAAWKRTGFYGGIVAFLLFLSAFGFAKWQHSDYMKADRAVVMAPVSSVKSSPSAGSAKDLFVLHEGTRVTINDSVGAYINIELADGRQGWIAASEIEVI